jgi:RNA polymerase sigma factor (sigma-70 family)
MTEPDSVKFWIQQLKAGDAGAAQPLWERYYRRLVGLARKKLGDAPRRATDEDDVVQSAFSTFCQRAREGLFPRLSDREDLWQLLVVITARKALSQRAHQQRAKRGGGNVYDQAAFKDDDSSFDDCLAQAIDSEPTPEFAAQAAEQLERVMDNLPDPTHRIIVLWKLEGRTNTEIARHLDCSLTSVERKLRSIREQLATELRQSFNQEISEE